MFSRIDYPDWDYFFNCFQGFNLDIQFQGGTIAEIQVADQNVDTSKAENIAKEATGNQSTHSYTLMQVKLTKELTTSLNVSSKDKLSNEEYSKLIDAIGKYSKLKKVPINMRMLMPQ